MERKMHSIEARKIPVIIPSYEPDEKLTGLLSDLRKEGFVHLVVVDDGSGREYERFFQLAEEEFHCDVLHHSVNQGKGRALKTAFDFVLQKYPDAAGCITADSDGQHSPSCILACGEALLQNPSALVMGCRNFDRKDVPARSEFGNKCTRVVMKYLAGVYVSDTQTGLRGISADFMKKLLSVKGERFEFETNMLMETKNEGVSIVEVPIRTIYIEENKSSHFHPIKDSIRIYRIFASFLFSSLSSSIVDLVLFSLFCYLFKDEQWGSITYITVATVLARILSAFYNYFINHRVVFQSKHSMGETIWKYALLAVVQMACSAFLVNALYPLFGGAEVLIKIPVDVALFFASFIIQRELVYR